MTGSNVVKLKNEKTWQEWVVVICASWQKGVDSIIETGRLLIASKGSIDHGEWEAMVQIKLPFGPRTAQMLMKIADHPVISNTKHASLLPPSWMTLHELTKLPPETLRAKIADGTITPKMERKDIAALRNKAPSKKQKPKLIEQTIEASARALSKHSRSDQIKIIRALMEKLNIGIRDFADTRIKLGK